MSVTNATTNSRRGRMFKLKLKGGVYVSTLEELRDNFDLERVVEYFKRGELMTWLEDRFYDDEADEISEIDRDDRNLAAKICAALNVECDNDDLDFVRRIREKKAALSEKTDDESIIDNAVATALNQEDLAALIQMDYKTIFLCGEQFNVPIRVPGMHYIGILGTPKIKIRAKSQSDLDAQKISFENVQLPWQKAVPIDELKALAEKIFQTGGKWPIVKGGKQVSTFDQLSKTEKSAALRMFAQGRYSESQIAFIQLTDDFSSGFALTTDAFCTGGGIGHIKIPYQDINRANIGGGDYFFIDFKQGSVCIGDYWQYVYNRDACRKLFSSSAYKKLVNFLEVAKNF